MQIPKIKHSVTLADGRSFTLPEFADHVGRSYEAVRYWYTKGHMGKFQEAMDAHEAGVEILRGNWLPIPDFPSYAHNEFGEVQGKFGRLLKHRTDPRNPGNRYVSLDVDGVYRSRSVKLLQRLYRAQVGGAK